MKFKTICNNKNWLDCSKSDREREMEKDNSNVLRENCQRDNQVRRSYGGKN